MKPLLLLCLLLAGCHVGNGPHIVIPQPQCGYVDLSGRYVPCECTKEKPCEA